MVDFSIGNFQKTSLILPGESQPLGSKGTGRSRCPGPDQIHRSRPQWIGFLGNNWWFKPQPVIKPLVSWENRWFHGKIDVFHGKIYVFHGKILCVSWENRWFHGKIYVFHGKIDVFHGKIYVFHGRIYVFHGKISMCFMGKSLCVSWENLYVFHGKISMCFMGKSLCVPVKIFPRKPIH